MTRLSRSGADVADERMTVGKIGSPHGIKGELRIIPITDFPERFAGMESIYVGRDRIEISSVRYQNDKILMAFVGFSSREAAASLTGKYLYIDREEAVPLNDGEYYISDLVGLMVYDDQEEYLGNIVDVIQTGSNDVYVVELPGGSRAPLLVPALKSVVREISLAQKKMVVKMPEEYSE